MWHQTRKMIHLAVQSGEAWKTISFNYFWGWLPLFLKAGMQSSIKFKLFSLLHDKMLDQSKLKAFPDNKLNVTQVMKF